MNLTEREVGIGWLTGSVVLGLGSWILHNLDGISGVLHVLLLMIAFVPAVIGLWKFIMVEVNKAVTLRLEPQQLNVILRGLEELPYRISHPVMVEIHTQVRSQVIPKVTDVNSEPRTNADSSGPGPDPVS